MRYIFDLPRDKEINEVNSTSIRTISQYFDSEFDSQQLYIYINSGPATNSHLLYHSNITIMNFSYPAIYYFIQCIVISSQIKKVTFYLNVLFLFYFIAVFQDFNI